MTTVRLFASAALAAFGLALIVPANSAVAAQPPIEARQTLKSGGDAPVVLVDRRRRDGDRDRYRRGYRDRDGRHWRYDYDRRERWRTGRHPKHRHWHGRRLPPRGGYYVITRYWDYHLPPPPRGYYYVREGNDVFLVLEATRTIIEAFILLELLSR